MKSIRLPILSTREISKIKIKNNLSADKGRWSTTICALKGGLLQMQVQTKAQTKAQRAHAWFWLDEETSRLLEEKALNINKEQDEVALLAIHSYLTYLEEI